MESMNTVYLDYNATTSIDPMVLEEMLKILKEDFGNPSSQSHIFGQRASENIEKARSQAAGLISSSASEIVFTSGATESCNMAIFGVADAYKERGNHIITSMTEHKAVLEPCRQLANNGFDITYLKPDSSGRISPQLVEEAITSRTILVSIMMANNVTGVINPVDKIAQICKKRGIIFFCDATQAAGKIPIDVGKMNLDLVAFSAHKIYGPKGTGALYTRKKGPRVHISPLILGGGQEKGLRGGTENVAGIVGFGKACDLAKQLMEKESSTLTELRNRFEQDLLKNIPDAFIFGSNADRLPNTTNISFPGIRADKLLKIMPEIAASTGSACDSTEGHSNYVLKASGVEEDLIAGSLRFSIGRFTNKEQIDFAIKTITQKIRELKQQ
jgi:cysteine desulfurase